MKLTLKEAILFALLGDLMFASKLLMEWLPNMHLLAGLTITFTVVFRQKALYPISVFIGISGVFYVFPPWWIPHLYLWVVLWGAVMLLPQKMPKGIANVVYIVVCGAHGFLYGVLYAPSQALLYGLDFKGMIAWIVAGLPFDVTHGISNLLLGVLIIPLVYALRAAKRRMM